jgi:hypothetical protein
LNETSSILNFSKRCRWIQERAAEVAEEVVDIITVAEEEEINTTKVVVVGMVEECSNSNKMINTTRVVAEEEAVAAAGTTKRTTKAMATSIKADIAAEGEAEDTGAVEVRCTEITTPVN